MLPTPPTTDLSPSPAVKQRKPRKPRGRGLRTTTGCAICRRRHMKCDEVKPVCGPCAKGNRPCVYGVPKQSAPSVTSEGEPPAATGPGSGGFTVPAEPSRRASDSQLPASRFDTVIRLQTSQSPWPAPIIAQQQPRTLHSPLLGRPRHLSGQDSTSDPGLPSAHLQWSAAPFDEPQTATTSPQSTFSFNSEVAPLKWFGLLADDADIDNDNLDRRTEVSDVSAAASYPTPQLHHLGTPHLSFSQPFIPTSTPRNSVPTGDERELWQSPTSLMDHEIPLFRKFVTQLSQWLDIFDPMRHFGSLVPQLAMNNEGILKAILALSARHSSIKPAAEDGTGPLDRTAAVQYYYETLQYLQRAMKYESYTKSLDIIATSLIVSTYEMVDGAGKSWERHLKGVFWIQRSQDNDGESGGLRQAVWWAWLRQDIWAAFRERRRCFSFWRPKRPYQMMDQFERASRAVYLLAQSVNYSSDEERASGESNLQTRIEKADHLMRMLDEWADNQTLHFKPLPLEEGAGLGPFRAIWVNPSNFAAAVQMHHFSRILLLIHRPAPGGFLEYLNRERQLMDAIDTIVGIALTVTEDAASIISTQCLFAAGLYCQDDAKREIILRLVEEGQQRTGWPVKNLGEELKQEWVKGIMTGAGGLGGTNVGVGENMPGSAGNAVGGGLG